MNRKKLAALLCAAGLTLLAFAGGWYIGVSHARYNMEIEIDVPSETAYVTLDGRVDAYDVLIK